MTPDEVLRKAAALIRKGWEQGSDARTASGDLCAPTCPEACRWCAWGALRCASDAEDVRVRTSAASLLAVVVNPSKKPFISNVSIITHWNDRIAETAEEVAGMMEKAADAYQKTKGEKHE